MNYSMCNW